CPLFDLCSARKQSLQSEYPPAKKKLNRISVFEKAVCCINARGEVLLRQSAQGQWRAGLWDFPEEVSPEGRLLGTVETRHVVTRHNIRRRTEVWVVSSLRNPKQQGEFRWIPLREGVWDARGNTVGIAAGSAFRKSLAAIRAKFPEAWLQTPAPEG